MFESCTRGLFSNLTERPHPFKKLMEAKGVVVPNRIRFLTCQSSAQNLILELASLFDEVVSFFGKGKFEGQVMSHKGQQFITYRGNHLVGTTTPFASMSFLNG